MYFATDWTCVPPDAIWMLAAWLFSKLCLMPPPQHGLPVAVGSSSLSSHLLLQIAASSWWHYSSSLSGVFRFLQTFIINSLGIYKGCSKEAVAHDMSQFWALSLVCAGGVLPLPLHRCSARCAKADWGACGHFWIPDCLKHRFLFTSLPQKLHGQFMEELRKSFASTSTCWNKQFLPTAAANEFWALSPFFGSFSFYNVLLSNCQDLCVYF